jgi:hypothetical protein
MEFQIDDEYLRSVTITDKGSLLENPDNPTHDDLIKILMGRDQWTMTRSEDHPEFAKLRDELEQSGYIRTQRSYWNGDMVVKPFTLNGAKFRKGEQFPSGAAIKSHIRYRLK